MFFQCFCNLLLRPPWLRLLVTARHRSFSRDDLSTFSCAGAPPRSAGATATPRHRACSTAAAPPGCLPSLGQGGACAARPWGGDGSSCRQRGRRRGAPPQLKKGGGIDYPVHRAGDHAGFLTGEGARQGQVQGRGRRHAAEQRAAARPASHIKANRVSGPDLTEWPAGYASSPEPNYRGLSAVAAFYGIEQASHSLPVADL